MTNVEKLLLQATHVKTYMAAIEAGLSTESPDSSKIDAAAVIIAEAEHAFSDLRKLLAECRGEASRGPTIEDIRQSGLRRHAEDQARSASGKTAN